MGNGECGMYVSSNVVIITLSIFIHIASNYYICDDHNLEIRIYSSSDSFSASPLVIAFI